MTTNVDSSSIGTSPTSRSVKVQSLHRTAGLGLDVTRRWWDAEARHLKGDTEGMETRAAMREGAGGPFAVHAGMRSPQLSTYPSRNG